jgi:hypothetical protein
VRRGASWTAAYHLQLTVAAVARPVGSSVVPSESLLLSGPGLLLAQTASARRSVQPTSSGQASSPWSTLPGRQPWHRSPVGVQHRVSTHPVSSSGCPAVQPSGVQPVRCPVTWVRRRVSGGPVVCCPPVRCPALWCPPVQRPAGWCPPRRSGRVRLLPYRPVALGPGRCGGHPSPRERVESRWAAAPLSGSVDGPAGLDAGGAAELACWSAGRRWRTRAGLGTAAARAR